MPSEFIDILKEILADGFTAVKFFKRIRVFSSIRKEAEDALRQTLGTIGTEDNDLGNQARSLLGNIDMYINSSATNNFWSALRIQEEINENRTRETLLHLKKKRHEIRVEANVIEEHDNKSDKAKREIIAGKHAQIVSNTRDNPFWVLPSKMANSTDDTEEDDKEEDNEEDDEEEEESMWKKVSQF
ncbi:hypothetical protein BC936DRAFT_145394 [Jimgerdemannia flammicorona]|uniref:Uncharacterized protein n=1 Tax=Jimgerdemannia flammicorona TaxID=994334 RepID=A0A433DA39_9FUNG|nr:hypothetical protein BC936DRAFT_145394 [Jimgerdemannia flammicorona]